MAIEIIRPRQRIECVEHALFFESKVEPGAGFAYPCGEDGKVLDPFHEARAAELRAGGEYREPRVQTSRRHYTECAVGRCTCGAEVALSDPLSNECEPCGRWYNMMGQSKINPHGELARALDAEGSY
ncbi:MAG TPA: hypothetical protein VIG97_02325 [Luteimonas sp.]